MTFPEMGVSPELIAILNKRGIDNPTDIQKLVFAPIVEGNSVLGLSKTGSGKTLAYLLPIVERRHRVAVATVSEASTPDAPQNDADISRVLILCPTRELAQQIHSELQFLNPGRTDASVLIVGGESESEQLRGFAASRYLVATPGRLLDLIKNSQLPLNSVRCVVLDEADRLLDMGFQEDIRDILGRVPKGFQLTCLSATLHLGVEELIYEMGVEFVRVNASSDADLTVEGLDHRVAFVGDHEKFHFLANFLKDRQDQRGIIFSNYRESAHRISKRLEGLGYRCEALSAQLSQPQRKKIMEDFRKEQLDILVASDVAARGLDVDALDFVVNFELPDDSATYVHRVGRTARAGRQGVAVSMVGFEDSFRLEKLETFLKLPISRHTVDPTWLEGPLPRGKLPPQAAAPARPYAGPAPRHQSRPRDARLQQVRQHSAPHPVRASTHKPYQQSHRQPAPQAKGSWLTKTWSKVLSLLGIKTVAVVETSAARASAHPASGERPRGGQRGRHRRGGRGGGGGEPRRQGQSQGQGQSSSQGHSATGGRGERGPRREGRPPRGRRPAGPRRDGPR